MIHYIKDSTLIIEGEFEAISSGINGGRGHVDRLFNHQVQPGFNHFEPAQYLNRLADSLQLQRPYFGLLTAVNMDDLCVSTDDYLTTFVTAGITHPSGFRVKDSEAGTINIILVVNGTLSEGAMAGAIITATEAKGLALIEMGYDFLGTTTDAVIVAYRKHSSPYIEYAGSYTEFGEKITGTVVRCVEEGIRKTEKRN
ncbi:MAG: adenosylcobinamide amidohydrolase [Methanosarcinales archaeon]|nr:adenosylcobinamide amidohydrolase [Methanosarcinales archaeon]MCD4810876.1 adenosylcobinamide amidohydrolase [Methanosarcinales archaeon]